MDANVLRGEALRRELPATATYLGIDITGGVGLTNLTAVAITHLAWRNGPVESWHKACPSRISDPEIMRANAATTRVVRGHLHGDVVANLADVLEPVRDALTDPVRRLPDGRTVLEVAAGAAEFQVYVEQVRAFVDRCGKLVAGMGSHDVVGALACYAAAACWTWWLAPGWPSIVDDIMNSPQGGPTDRSSMMDRPSLHGELDRTRLRAKLLAGPDRLSALEARYCWRLASRDVRAPQAYGLSPRSRRLLPPTHQNLINYLDFPTERYRQQLDELDPTSHPRDAESAAKHRRRSR